jgi:hypothetical protein
MVATASAAVAQAPLPDTPEAFGTMLKSWAAGTKAAQAFVVVRRDGRIVYRSAVGDIDPRAPVHLASLSKAITGACIATIIRDGKLAFDTPVSSALARFIARHGNSQDARFARATVAQLLTHRAGFGTKRNDPASGPALVQYLKTATATARPTPFPGRAIGQKLATDRRAIRLQQYRLSRPAPSSRGDRRQYAPYCRGAVLAPLGVAGEFEPSWRVMWSWRLAHDRRRLFGVPGPVLMPGPKTRRGCQAWMLDPTDKVAATSPGTASERSCAKPIAASASGHLAPGPTT